MAAGQLNVLIKIVCAAISSAEATLRTLPRAKSSTIRAIDSRFATLLCSVRRSYAEGQKYKGAMGWRTLPYPPKTRNRM